ncbi:hypothetical protein PFICI_13090 [Pestalotiopsis fici W106-1]|uniref:Uncharacterized protein n=1 Tax=Pestalotiopsis fici (strain W106-1 / CGMCC3.15140) TaxID=1229662 RepID=W3WP66_PESFW|nr:uncharacterized protein PFICI_13090 [Pestalotiopsis fici W106-1]ETS74606.1 hypothetical protein PFICI_13090 [Pestalotiopsis fici W106-1]
MGNFIISNFGQRNATDINTNGSSRDSLVSESASNTMASYQSGGGRESLVSVNSCFEYPQQNDSWNNGQDYPSEQNTSRNPRFEIFGQRYEQVPTHWTSRGQPSHTLHRDTFKEDEEYDMSLLKAAAPLGMSSGDMTTTNNDFREPTTPVFDMTSFSGPMGSQNHDFIKNLQKQEANGKLTGGLGAGINPDATMNTQQLLATSPAIDRSFSFSRALSIKRKPSARKEIRNLGQTTANKTGEVIEVIMEEPSDIDLSSMTGPNPAGVNPDHFRQSTFPRADAKKEVFYPQPNWKPFTMRWPYLTSMILLSLGLAITQEVLYQQSRAAPLMKFQRPGDINPFDYFILKFLPTIVTVTFGVLWTMADFEVRRLEAFYQMSKEGGALAAESINVDYLTLFNLMRPIRALHRKHYAVAVSSIISLLAVSLVPTLGSAAIVMNPDKTIRHNDPLVEKTITMHPTLSRLLTSTFLIIAILGVGLLHQLQSRRSGLLADVKGIAGLASMAVVSHIMMDFKDMDVAKPKAIHSQLRNHRYVLRNSSLAPDDSSSMTTQEKARYKEAHLSENPHPIMLRAEGAIPFIIGILLFLGFIFVLLFSRLSEVTDKAPWIVTALAVCIKLAWESLETDMRMMEPYYILSKRHAPAKTLTLDYTAMPFGWITVRALLNQHWLVALVGFGTVLAETLTIFVTSLATVEGKDFVDQIRSNMAHGGDHPPRHHDDTNQGDFQSGQETVQSFVVSLGFAVFILLYMLVVATRVFVRRRHPFLPRQPNTIASILAFMHQSKMLYDFVGTAKLGTAEVALRLQDLGKTYGLGWFEGRDGQTHCGVDEEELSGPYIHGIDFSQAAKPWDREWQLF